MASVNDIRASFLEYFRKQGHQTPASAPLVPHNDATLLFTNAGMVPFKTYFTGAEVPFAPRAATSQKCVRAGGKHNDLDNVGYTARHHTFFEMLGNFSFGDYFKEQAIVLAWSLLTKDWGLPADKLTVTVYHDDDEAAALWRKIAGLPADRIVRIATADNFWSMGDTGPCGPCSEIFYDHGPAVWGGPPGSAEADGDRYVEIWNLVFMQYEQFADGRREKLPKPSIDTGMGLERVAAVLQGVHSNYDIDLFKTLIAKSVALTGQPAEGEAAASHRVIADHLRASAFLIADGVSPANEGRGYVLRRIMRRAMRHAHLLGAEEPLLHRLAPTLAAEMGAAFPELHRALPVITDQLHQEEERFRRTLGKGLALLNEEIAALPPGAPLAGDTAFKLYDTFGFPVDLTADILRGQGRALDEAGFDAAMERQREKGRESWAGAGPAGDGQIWLDLKARCGETVFLGYAATSATATVTAIVTAGGEAQRLESGQMAALVLDQTPFYGESGGQIGDTGVISFDGGRFLVEETQKLGGGVHAHFGRLEGAALAQGALVTATIDAPRRDRIRSNHSATHLLHAALRAVLGPHVTQKGSAVDPDRLRFDFSHGAPVTGEQLEAIEAQVNAVIRQNAPATIAEMAPDAAIAAGAMALFGEKYGDSVRVLTLGTDLEGADKPFSVELCGGTHVARTGDIAVFTILSEAGVAAGVRRIEATTGLAALTHLKAQAGVARAAAAALKSPLGELPDRVQSLMDERRRLERDLADAKKRLALAGGGTGGSAAPAGPETVGQIAMLAQVLDGVPAKDLRGLIDEAKTRLGTGVVAYIGVEEGKAALAVGVTPDLAKVLSAVDLVRIGVAALGGQGGGGRPDMAQGGGPNAAAAAEALAKIKAMVADAFVG